MAESESFRSQLFARFRSQLSGDRIVGMAESIRKVSESAVSDIRQRLILEEKAKERGRGGVGDMNLEKDL